MWNSSKSLLKVSISVLSALIWIIFPEQSTTTCLPDAPTRMRHLPAAAINYSLLESSTVSRKPRAAPWAAPQHMENKQGMSTSLNQDHTLSAQRQATGVTLLYG